MSLQVIKMSPVIKDVLSSLGWSESLKFHSNDDNLKLLEMIKISTENCNEKQNFLQVRQHQKDYATNLLSNSENEFGQNIKLTFALKSQITTEHHLMKLAEHETSKLQKDILIIEKSQKDLEQQEISTKCEIFKLNTSIDKLSECIQWAKSALVEWRQVMNRGEDANILIQKFCKMDIGKAETLDTKRRVLQDSIIKQRFLLCNTIEEKIALEQVLERTSQLYRQAHNERRQLVNTWKEAVAQMTQREKNIKDVEIETVRAKNYTDTCHAAQAKHSRLLDMKKIENLDTEYQISELNLATSDLKNRLNKLEEILASKKNELQTLRKIVQNQSQKLISMRHENRQILSIENDKILGLETGMTELEVLNGKLDKFKDNNLDALDRLKQINEILESETRNMKTLEVEMTRLSGVFYRSEQQLFKLREAEKLLKTECQNLEVCIMKIKIICKQQEKELLRQTEIIYNIDFNLQSIETRIANMKGFVEENHALLLEERCKYLKQLFHEKQNTVIELKNQNLAIECEMKRLTTISHYDLQEFNDLKKKVKGKKVFVEGGKNQLKLIRQETQEMLVEHNMLKMKILQMEKQLTKQNDKTYTLEKHKLLEAAIFDRLIDIRAQQDLLIIKRKCLLDERSQMKADINDRALKISHLVKRYESTTDLLGKNEDGTLITSVQIKIEIAQEKYILLSQGNYLNDKIFDAENEIKILDNTLKMINFSNDIYKKTFEKIKENSPEIKIINALKAQHLQAENSLKSLKNNSMSLLDNIEMLNNEKEEVVRILEEVQRMKLDSNDTLLKLHKELMDQETKLQRAEREMRLAVTGAKKRIHDIEFLTLFEKDVYMKERDDKNNLALQQMADLVEAFPTMTQTVTRHFIERGLSMPRMRRTKSQCSWKSDISLGDFSMKPESSCKRYSHRSILSGSSTSSNNTSKASSKTSIKHKASSGLSVIKINFPDDAGKSLGKPEKITKTLI